MKLKSAFYVFFIIVILASQLVSAAETEEQVQQRIEERQDLILRTLDRLAFQKGLTFSGRVKLDGNLYNTDGPAVDTNYPVRKNLSFLEADMTMRANPTRYLSVEWILRFHHTMGDWGGYIESRDLFFRMDLFDFMRFDIGNFRHSLTPFLLSVPSREFYHDAPIFKTKREDELYNAYLDEDDKRPLEGINMSTGFYVDNIIDEIHINAFAALLQTGPDRIMAGGRVNVLRNDKLINAGVNGLIIEDIKETVWRGSADLLSSKVWSVDAEINPVKIAGLFGEFAYSSMEYFTNSIRGTPAETDYSDSAFRFGAVFDFIGTSVKGYFLSVGNEYYAPGAQTSSWESSDQNLLVEEKQEEIRAGFHDRVYHTSVFMGRRYDHSIFLSQPMNLATPNRRGIRVQAHSETIESIDIKADLSVLDSIRGIAVSNVRHFVTVHGGARIDLAGLTGISFLPAVSAFYYNDHQTREDDVSLTLDESEDLMVSVLGAGVEWKVTPKFSLQAGYNMKKTSGRNWLVILTEFNPLSDIMKHLEVNQDILENVIGLGFQYDLSKTMFVQGEYYYKTYMDNLDADQEWVNHTVRFYTRTWF